MEFFRISRDIPFMRYALIFNVISAVTFVMQAIALAPGVPTVLATVRTTTTNDDAKLNQPLAQQSCAAFENWFLIPLAGNRASRRLHERNLI